MNMKVKSSNQEYQRGIDIVIDEILDDREVCGKKGEQKIELIEKIQAHIKGHMTRQQYLDFRTDSRLNSSLSTLSSTYADYTNPHVQDIKKQMGPFDYGMHIKDRVKREVRTMATVEDGARYEGEWNVDTGERDGKGVQFWEDGSLYEGYWKNGKANGKGRLIRADEDVYIGNWKDDMLNG